jgi:hypothetical protein
VVFTFVDAYRQRPGVYDALVMLVIGLLNLLCGLGFAIVAKDRVRADGPLATPAFALVGLHAGAIVAPIALYFYVVHPAWSWMYWIEPKKVSVLAALPLMAGHAGLVLGSWALASIFIRRQMVRAVTYAAGAIFVATIVLLLVCSHRLTTAADFIGYQAGKGTSMFNVVLGWALVVAVFALLVSAAYVVIELLRDGRRVRAR